MSNDTIIAKLSNWSASFDLDDVPEEVRTAARRSLLDTIGVMLAAEPHPLAEKISRIVVDQYAKGSSEAIGVAGTVSATGAAFANGTAAHVLDFDDTSYAGILHGSAVAVPAVLAAAQHADLSGEKFLAALIAAFEATYTIGTIITPKAYDKGWWTSGTAGIPGATLGVARALNLSSNSTRNALALATVEAFGSRGMFGSDAKPHLAGRAASAAVSAGLSAHAGVTGNHLAFEHERGFFTLMTNGTIESDAIDTIGKVWRQLDPGILYKRFPVCSAAHSAIEAAEVLKNEHVLSADDIMSIDCEVPKVVAISLIYDDPKSPQQAQFSLPYTVACMLIHDTLTYQHLSDEVRQGHDLQSLRAKVSMRVADDLASDPSAPEGVRMTIKTADGRALQKEIRTPLGMPQNPLSDDQLRQKFFDCGTSAGWNRFRLEALADAIWSIHKQPTVRNLLRARDTLLESRGRLKEHVRKLRPRN